MNEFVTLNNFVVNVNAINWVDVSELDKLILGVYFGSSGYEKITGLRAVDLLMIIKPSAMEGKRLRWAKNKWLVHNFVAHPIMQLLALCKLPRLGLWLHDVTVPRPYGAKKSNDRTRATPSSGT